MNKFLKSETMIDEYSGQAVRSVNLSSEGLRFNPLFWCIKQVNGEDFMV